MREETKKRSVFNKIVKYLLLTILAIGISFGVYLYFNTSVQELLLFYLNIISIIFISYLFITLTFLGSTLIFISFIIVFKNSIFSSLSILL